MFGASLRESRAELKYSISDLKLAHDFEVCVCVHMYGRTTCMPLLSGVVLQSNAHRKWAALR
jgi:hypothetical protein